MSRIILASASPRRRELLAQIGLAFDVIPSTVSEEGYTLPPAQLAEHLAEIKARDIAKIVDGPGYVIGADTIVVVDGIVFGKPADELDAHRMLSHLQGRDHQVITGIAVIRLQDGLIKTAHEITTVTMRELTGGEIDAYIASGEPADKAGAYAIQGLGARFIPGICGCYFNVVGLPIVKLLGMLKELGWSDE